MLKLYFLTFTLQITFATIYPYFQILLRNMGFSQSIVGVLIGCSQLSACIFPLFICNQADKTSSRKLFCLLAALVLAFSYTTLVCIPKLPVVLIFSIICYACSGSLTSITDSTFSLFAPKYNVTYSSIRAFGTVGYVIILTLFSLTGFPDSTNNKQLLLTTLISIAFLFCFIILNPNPVNDKSEKDSKKFSLKWFNESFYLFIAIFFIKNVACSVFDKLLGSYMTEVMGLGNKFSLIFALGATSEFIFMIIFGKMLKDNKISEFSLFVLSCIGIFVRLIIYVFTNNTTVFILAQLIHAFTFGAAHVACISYISKRVNNKHISLATAIFTSIGYNLSEFAGSLAGGFIIDNLGYKSLFAIYSIFPVIALILIYIFKNKIFSQIKEG